MSDDVDLATDRQEKELAARLKATSELAALQANKPLPISCINGCGSTPRERSRYCSTECREDHESRLARAKRLGAR